MADFNNDRRDTVVVREDRKSVWRWLAPLLLVLALLVGLYILFSPANEDATINTPDQVQIDTPNADAPDVDVQGDPGSADIDAPNADVDVNRTEDGNDTAQ